MRIAVGGRVQRPRYLERLERAGARASPPTNIDSTARFEAEGRCPLSVRSSSSTLAHSPAGEDEQSIQTKCSQKFTPDSERL